MGVWLMVQGLWALCWFWRKRARSESRLTMIRMLSAMEIRGESVDARREEFESALMRGRKD